MDFELTKFDKRGGSGGKENRGKRWYQKEKTKKNLKKTLDFYVN